MIANHFDDNRLNLALTKLSAQLVPSSDYFVCAINAGREILKFLKNKSHYSIDRALLLPIESTKTIITDYTFHLTIFFNNQHPPFLPELLNSLQSLLNTHRKVSQCRITKYSLQFDYNSSIFMELCPATNYLKNREITKSKIEGENMITNQPTFNEEGKEVDRTVGRRRAWQALKVYKKIQAYPSRARYYSSSLSESHLEFLRSQTSFTASLIRLCKFWNQSLFIPGTSVGHGSRPILIELVAIYAGKLEERQAGKIGRDYQMGGAFSIFLQSVAHLNNIRIEFDFDALQPIRDVIGAHWTLRTEDTLRVRTPPWIIEPANPFSNLVKCFNSKQIGLFQKYAIQTMYKLSHPYLIGTFYEPVLPGISQLLCPKPSSLFKSQIMTEEEKEFLKGCKILPHVEAYPFCQSCSAHVKSDDRRGRGYDENGYFQMKWTRGLENDSGITIRLLKHLCHSFTVIAMTFLCACKVEVQGVTWVGCSGDLEQSRLALQLRVREWVDKNLDLFSSDSKSLASSRLLEWDYESVDKYENLITYKIPLRVTGGLLVIWIRVLEPIESEDEED